MDITHNDILDAELALQRLEREGHPAAGTISMLLPAAKSDARDALRTARRLLARYADPSDMTMIDSHDFNTLLGE